jgi:hypothetical protein
MEGVDLDAFEQLPFDRLRCRECRRTGMPPQVVFGVRFAWWGDEHQGIGSHPWTCSSCPRRFTTAGGLSHHRRAAHP